MHFFEINHIYPTCKHAHANIATTIQCEWKRIFSLAFCWKIIFHRFFLIFLFFSCSSLSLSKIFHKYKRSKLVKSLFQFTHSLTHLFIRSCGTVSLFCLRYICELALNFSSNTNTLLARASKAFHCYYKSYESIILHHRFSLNTFHSAILWAMAKAASISSNILHYLN